MSPALLEHLLSAEARNASSGVGHGLVRAAASAGSTPLVRRGRAGRPTPNPLVGPPLAAWPLRPPR